MSLSRAPALTLKQTLCFIGFGFASGLPFQMVLSTLGVRLTEAGASLIDIGFFSLATLPYSLKFFLSPLIDFFELPYLKKLGKRKAWALIFQSGLILSLVSLGYTQPHHPTLWIGFLAFLVSFFATLQDIALESLRIDQTPPQSRGTSAWAVCFGFRIGFLLSGGGALYLATYFSWAHVYQIIALGIVLSSLAVFYSDDPHAPPKKPRSLHHSIVHLFKRQSLLSIASLLILSKMTDILLSTMGTPFILSLGYSKIEFATCAKGYGLIALITGGFLAGIRLNRKGLAQSFLAAFIFQLSGAFCFFLHTIIGYSKAFLAVSMIVENFASGFLGTVIIAYITALAKKPHTATQYGILASLSSLVRIVWSVGGGGIASTVSWHTFFFGLLCAQSLAIIFLIPFYNEIRRSWQTNA